jgi:hypothetical protein
MKLYIIVINNFIIMAQYQNIDDNFYPGYSDTEGTTIFTKVILSTTRELEPFWGVELTLPTAKILHNNIVVMRSPDEFIKEFKIHLEKISEPFPLLKEKLKYFKVFFHGENWEKVILEQYMDNVNEIYFCDHEH